MFTKTQITLWTALAVLSAPTMVMAADTAASSSSSSSILQTLKKNASASYTFWISGPKLRSFRALSGETDSTPGTNLSLLHLPSLGYKITPKFK